MKAMGEGEREGAQHRDARQLATYSTQLHTLAYTAPTNHETLIRPTQAPHDVRRAPKHPSALRLPIAPAVETSDHPD
jgi:hypothetical protein